MSVREKLDDSLVFSVRRGGVLARGAEVVDSQGDLVGTVSAKTFSIGGGYAVHDAAGAHFGDVRGNTFAPSGITPQQAATLQDIAHTTVKAKAPASKQVPSRE